MQYQEIMHGNGTIWEQEWLPNQPKLYTCAIIIHCQEKYISKGTIEIYRTASQKEFSAVTPQILAHYKSWKNEKLCNNVSGFFAPINGNQVPKTVLIEGVSGVGKTILVNQIAYHWKYIHLLCKKAFVFLLNLWDQDVANICTVYGMASHFFKNYLHTFEIKQIYAYIHETKGSCVAVILDGYNETSVDMLRNSFFTDLIHKKILKECTVIVTSQPLYCMKLQDRACRRIEMLGFSEDHRDAYLVSAFKSTPHKYKQLKSHMQNNPTIDRLCCVPLNLTFLVFLLSHGYCLPTTKTELFEKFVCYIFTSYLSVRILDNLTQFDNVHARILKELAKYSFDLLKKDKVIFSLEDLITKCPKCWSIMDQNPCSLGLLKQVQHFPSRETSYSFLHPALQEYLVAYHLSQLDYFHHEFDATFHKCFLKHRYVNMWTLFFGVVKEKDGSSCLQFVNKFWQATMKPIQANDMFTSTVHDKMKYLYVFQCFKEGNQKEMCARIRDSLGDEISFSGHRMLSDDMITLSYVITQSLHHCHLKTLDLTDCKIGNAGCKYLYQQLQHCFYSCKLTVDALILSNNQLTRSSVNHVIYLAQLLKVKVLDLSSNHFCSEAKYFVDNCQRLEILSLINNGINDACVLSKDLFYSKCNHHFSIAFTRECLVLQQDCINSFTVWNTFVKALFLDCTKASTYHHVERFLQRATSLEIIHLRTQSSFNVSVLNFSNLKEVYVSQLSDEDAVHLINALSETSNAVLMVTSESILYASNVHAAKIMNFTIMECRTRPVNEIHMFSCIFDIKCLAEVLSSKKHFPVIRIMYCNVGDNEVKYLYERQCFITVNELCLSGGSLKSVEYLKKLIAYWEVKSVHFINEHLSCNGLKEITGYIKNRHLELELLNIQGFAYDVNELDNICESLFLDPEYSVDLSVINLNSIIIKGATDQNIDLIVEHGNKAKDLNLYITESNKQLDYLPFDYLCYIQCDMVLQKLYLKVTLMNIENFYSVLEEHKHHIKCLCLSVDTLPDKNSDDIMNLCRTSIPIFIMSETKVHARSYVFKNPITICPQSITFVSLIHCVFSEITLTCLVESLIICSSELTAVDLSQCKLGDHGIQVVWSVLKHKKIFSSVKSLNLSGNDLSHHSVGYLTDIISIWNISSFHGSNNSILGIGMEKFIAFATKNSNITFIDLLDNKAMGIEEFCKNVYFSDKKHLSFVVANNGVIITKQFCNVLMKKGMTVQSLYLCNSISEFTSDSKQFDLHTIVFLDEVVQSLNSLCIINHANSAVDYERLGLHLFPNLHQVYLEIMSLSDLAAGKFFGACVAANISAVIITKSQFMAFKTNEEIILQTLFRCDVTLITTLKLITCKVRQRLLTNIGKAISNCNKTWDEICLKNCDISKSHVQILVEYFLARINSKVKVTKLDLSSNKLTVCSLKYLSTLVSTWETDVLNFEENSLSNEILHNFSDFIKSSQIQHLHMQRNFQVESQVGQMLCETMVFSDNCNVKFAQITENFAFINASTTDSNFCDSIKQTFACNMYLKIHFDVFQQKKYVNALELFKKLLNSLHILKYLCIIITSKEYLYEDLFEVIMMNIKKMQNLVICTERISDIMFTCVMKHSQSNYSVGIISQRKLLVSNAGTKMLNYCNMLSHKYFHSKNITNISLASCEISNEDSFDLLTTSLIATCENIVDFTLQNCALEDKHVFQLQNALKQASGDSTIKKLDLSGNRLQSFGNAVNKLCYLLQVEELILANNQIQIEDIELIARVLTSKKCSLNYIDLQNNQIKNVEVKCRRLLFALDFNFNVLVIGHGCIINRRFDFKIQSGMTISSLFLTFKESLTYQEFQGIFQLGKSSTLNRLFIIAMFQNEIWHIIAERIKFVIVTEELYLCVPNMDDKNLDHFWQYDCKSKLILSKTNLRALNVQDSEILHKTLTYITAESNVIALENTSVSYVTMKKLALVISNNGSDKVWQTFKLHNCNIFDNHINIFYEKFYQDKKQNNVRIKFVDLSQNKITHSVMKEINQLLEQWQTEELNIAKNDLRQIGIQRLIQSDNIFTHLHVLDTQHNNVQYTNEVSLLCEYLVLNKELNCLHLISGVLIVNGSVFTDRNNHELVKKTNVSDVYLKFKSSKQERLLPNIQMYLVSLHSLQHLFIAISGNIADNKLLKLLRKVNLSKTLVILAESLSEDNFRSFIKHHKPNYTICMSSVQNLYIANSDDEMFKQLLNCTNRNCKNITSVMLHSCVMHKNSDSIKLLVTTLLNGNTKEINHHLLEVSNCIFEYEHVHKFYSTLLDKLKFVKLSIKVLDLSNNYLDSQSIMDLVEISCILQIEDLILKNNQLTGDDVKMFMKLLTDRNCHLRYINLQNNHIHNVDKYFNSFFFSFDFNFSIIMTNNGCVMTKRLSCLKMQHAKVKCLYLSIREPLASDPDLQELQQILAPSTILNSLYVAILQHTFSSFYHILKTIEFLVSHVSEDLYLCIPEMDSASANRIWKHQCNSKLILAERKLQAENIKDSEVIFKTLDHVNNTGLETIVIDSSSLCHKTTIKLASVLLNNNVETWQSLRICGCNFTDDHIKVFYKALIDSENPGKHVAIKVVDFSNNKISTSGLEMVIKLLEHWRSEELLLAGNDIQYNGLQTLLDCIARKEEVQLNNQVKGNAAMQVSEIRNKMGCPFECIDLQSNPLSDVDDVCKRYFFILDFNFTFMAAKNGIVIMRELLFNVWLRHDINSLYLAIGEVISEQGKQNLIQIMNKSSKVKRLCMYIAKIIHNERLADLIQAAKSLTVTKELFLCVPDMDATNAHEFWQCQCKNKIVLSKHTLQGTHIDDTKMLLKTFDYITLDLQNISLEYFSMCCTTMKRLAAVISSNGKDRNLNSLKLCNCNITDDHVICFYEQFTQCKNQGRVLIKSVDLSSNKITSYVTREIISVLKQWQSEDLVITGNNFQYSGLAQLISSQDMNIITLDTRQNNMQLSSIEEMTQMCEYMTFNHSFKFTFARLTKDVLMIDASVFNSHHPEVKCKSDVLSIYIKGNCNLEGQNFIPNVQAFLSSFSYLENLFIAIQGHADFDSSFIELLRDKTLIVQFIIYAKSMSANICKSLAELDNIMGTLLQQKFYISNSDDKVLNNMLNNMTKHCEDLTTISIHNCTMSSYSFELLAKGLMCTSKKLTEVSMNGCKIEDGHIKHFYEILKQSYQQTKAEFLTIKILQLSNNCLKSLGVVEELACMLQTEKLHLNNNQVQGSDAACILDTLRKERCPLKFITLQNNCISNADDLCKKCYFDFEFNFMFIITKSGIIITKELLLDIQLSEDISSLYLMIREALPEQSLQSIMDKVPTNFTRLYITMFKCDYSANLNIRSLTVTDDIYFCIPDMDIMTANEFQQCQCKHKLMLSKRALQVANIDDTKVIFETFNYITTSLNTISLENVRVCHTVMKVLAAIISNDGNDKEWNTLKLSNCNITDDHVQCFYEHFIQYKKQGKIRVNSVDLSHNMLSSFGMGTIIKLLQQCKSKELMISGNNLQYDGLVTLVHTIISESCSVCLQRVDAQLINMQCCRGQVAQLCELIVFNNNCYIKYANIEGFLIMDGNYLDDNSTVVDVSSICFTGNISASRQVTFLAHVKNLLLSRKGSLENLYILLPGELSLDKNFFNDLKQIKVAKQLVIHVKNIPGRNFMNSFVNQFKESSAVNILSRESLYVSNSNEKLLLYMLNYMDQHYNNVCWISIDRCVMIKSSQNLDLLVKAMIGKGKKVKCLALTHCELGCNEIVLLHRSLSCEQYVYFGFTVKAIDFSNNCLESECGKSLVELASICKAKEIVLANNKLSVDDTVAFMDHLNDRDCSLKYIDCQNNCLKNLENICGRYFLNHCFDFGFLLCKGGIVLTKSISYSVFSQWKNKLSDTNALYVRKTTILTSKDFHGLMSYLNLGMQLQSLHMALHENETLPILKKEDKSLMPTALDQNESLQITEKDLNYLLPSRVLYVYAPKVIKTDLWWQHECKSKSVLSKQILQASNITDSVVLHDILNNSLLVKTLTIIKFINCSLHSDSLLTKLAQTLCSSNDSKIFQTLEVCSCCISDSDIQYFHDRLTEYRKTPIAVVKCLNLSNNKITSSSVQIIVSLLKNCKIEELVITGNSLDADGIQSIINASKGEISTLKILDTQENNLLYLGSECLSTALFLDSAPSICYFRIKPRSINTSGASESIVIKQRTMKNFAIQIDMYIGNTENVNFRHCLFTDKEEGDIAFNLLNCLKLTTSVKKICVLGPIVLQKLLPDVLKQNDSIQELHLYVPNMTNAVQVHIMQNLPKTCNSVTVLSASSFTAIRSSCSYIKKGIHLVLQQTHSSFESLNNISFTYCEMDSETVCLLHEMVWNCKCNKTWKTIDLSNCALGDKLGLFLKQSSKVQHEVVVKNINLSFNNLNSASVDLITNTILSCKLKRLYINDNNLKDDGVEKFKTSLINCNQLIDSLSLKVLKMENNGITYPTAETFVDAIQRTFNRRTFWLCIDHVLLLQESKCATVPKDMFNHSFKSIYVLNCNINAIFSFEHIFGNLENICICNNNSTSKSQPTINNLIRRISRHNYDVSTFVVLQQELIAKSYNTIKLTNMLKEVATLKFMSFENCEITSEILIQIVRLLPVDEPLYKLSFGSCSFGKDGCKVLLQLLNATNSKVVSLSLPSNQIESHADVKFIADICSHLKVSELHLNNNKLQDNEIKYFAEILKNREHVMKTIDLRSNHTCSVTEGEFMHISNCKLQVFITAETKIYYKDDHEVSTDLDDGNIKYLYFIKYEFTVELFDKLLPYDYLNKFHLVGELNMNSEEFVMIIQVIQTDELLIVARNFTPIQALNLFNSATCSIVIAIEGTILGKNCINSELINTALEYTTFSSFTKVHFTNCKIVDIDKTITSLLQFYKHSWEQLQVEHCNFDDNACVNLAHMLSSAETIIQSVSFSSNFLTSSSTEAIVSIINNSKVSKLCLNNNKFSVEDVECTLNTVMMTYNMQEISCEENGIDELQLIHMIKHKFLSFQFDCIYDISGLYYNCHILAYSSPKRCYFYRFFIDSYRSNVFTIYDSEFQINKLFINVRTLLFLQLLENDLYFLSGTIGEIYTIMNCTLSDFNGQQLNKQASMSIKLILSNESITSLKLLQSQTDTQLPCLTILVGSQVDNTEGMLSKLVSSMPEISFVHILVTKMANVSNVIEKVLMDLLSITSMKMFWLHIKEGVDMHSKIISEIIANNKDLELLNLSNNNLGSSEISYISNGIKYISSLQSINFSNNNISVRDRECLMIALMKNDEIKEINISNNPIYHLDISLITTLTTLDLSYTNIGINESNINNLKGIMDNNVNLQTLNLRGNNIGDKIVLIASALQNKMLRCFDISYNELTCKVAKCISYIIQMNPLLKVLDISNNSSLSSKDIKKCGVTTILQALQPVELPLMRSLNLSHTGNTNKATAINLTKALVRFKNLEKINISDVTVNINIVLKCIELMAFLKVLVLQNCNIDCNNAHLLSHIIAKNAHLHTLNVNNNSIMNTGFKIILSAFLAHHVCHLKVLQVANNNITLDKPLIDVDKASGSKLQLDHLDISNNNLKVAAVYSLLNHLVDVHCLRILKLCKVQDVQDEGNARVLNYLAIFAKKLEYLDISGYNFSNDKLEEFLEHIHLAHINISYTVG